MGRRIRALRRWAPRSDPLLCGVLLGLHAALLLRLALAGSLEAWPLPLAGVYLSWQQLRMMHRWVSRQEARQVLACQLTRLSHALWLSRAASCRPRWPCHLRLTTGLRLGAGPCPAAACQPSAPCRLISSLVVRRHTARRQQQLFRSCPSRSLCRRF